MEQHSSSFRPRGPSMEEEASSSHMQPPPRAHRPFSPASPPSPTTAMTPPLLVRLPPELLRAVATAFLMAKERARLSLACRHCHDAWCRHTPRLALRPPPRGKRHTTPQSPLRVLLSRPARTQSLEQLTLHNAGWTLPALLAVLLGEGEGVGVVLPSLTHLELHTSNASPSSLPFTSVTAWGEEEEEGQRQHHLQLQQEEEEEEETGDPAMSVTRPLTRAMGVGLGQAMREGKLPALVKLGLRRVAMAGQGKQGEEGEVVAALIEGGLLPLPSSDGGGYPPCPRLAEFDLGGTYMGQQGAAALARACRLRGNVGGCCGLASLSLGWWEEAPGQQGRQQQTRLSSNGAEDGEQEEELLARVLCTAYCKGLRRLTLSTDIALTAKELGSVERYLREGGGGSLEVLSVEASSGAAGGGQEEEEEGDGGQGFLQVLQNIAVQAAQMQQHLQGLAEASVVGPDGNPLVVIGPPQAPAAQPAAPAIGGMEDLGAAGVAGGVAAVQAGQEVAEGVMGGIAAAAAAAAGVQAVGAAQGALMEGVDFFLPPFLRRSVGGNGTGIAAALVEARPQNLRVLELRSCKLKGALLGHVCNGLGAGAWPVLEELRLSLGDLDAGAVRVLCRDGLGRMKGKGASLRVLELSGNEFCPNGGAVHLGDALRAGVCPNLKELALETVGLRDNDLERLLTEPLSVAGGYTYESARNCCLHTSLETLRLSNSFLTSYAASILSGFLRREQEGLGGLPPLLPRLKELYLNRAFGSAEDDFTYAFAPEHELLPALEGCCPNLEVLSCRGCDLDPRTTLSAFTLALKPHLYLPRPTRADVLDAETAAGSAIGPVLQQSSSHPRPCPCPFPRLRLLDLRMNGLDLALREQEEEEVDDEFGPMQPLSSLRRCLHTRQQWAERWNELQHKGKDRRVASLTVLV